MNEQIEKNLWRFPGNNYTNESGLDTSDMETFKKDPISSLARELCQNSIDARLDVNHPVIVEFNLFQIENEKIPGKKRILQEVVSCGKEWAYHHKISTQLKEMEKSLNKKNIDCLRISDFNTTGLKGVSTGEKSSWYLLTKGSGISDKSGTTGGSKGIGKFATFVASEFNTVFYSTQTIDNEFGYEGICKLCSTSMEISDEKTQGIGYYGRDEKNNPILEQYSLEPGYSRTEPGTDIFIVGFRQETTWIKDIVTKVLDSFMSAIVRNQLIIKIQDIILNKDTLKDLIYNDDYILKSSQKDIIAQYALLNDEKVYKENFDVMGYGNVELFVKRYEKEENNEATNNCVMIRYSYMKIKTLKNISILPCSAMCIIGNNKLNSILRDLENPQHTDWEIKRITDYAKRSEVRGIIRELNKNISNIIKEFLSTSDTQQTDIEGASDYLPDANMGDVGDNKFIIAESAEVTKPKKNKSKSGIGDDEDDYAESLIPDIGELEEGEGAPMPEGHNEGDGGQPTDSDKEGDLVDGDNDALRYVSLSGIKYRFIVLNKLNGKYAVVFNAPQDEEECEMSIFYVDESGKKYPVEIQEAHLNKAVCKIVDNEKVLFNMFKDKKHQFELVTDQEDLFACEVKIHAYR